MHKRDEKCFSKFSAENLKVPDHFEDIGVGGRIILELSYSL
jgi:hypothetical protein